MAFFRLPRSACGRERCFQHPVNHAQERAGGAFPVTGSLALNHAVSRPARLANSVVRAWRRGRCGAPRPQHLLRHRRHLRRLGVRSRPRLSHRPAPSRRGSASSRWRDHAVAGRCWPSEAVPGPSPCAWRRSPPRTRRVQTITRDRSPRSMRTRPSFRLSRPGAAAAASAPNAGKVSPPFRWSRSAS